MLITIQVLSVTVNHVPNAKGGYDVAEVAYKDLKDGKVNGKKIMSFVAKDVFNAIKDVPPNTILNVTIEKEAGRDGKEYWQWKEISKGEAPTGNSAPTSAGNPSPRSTYETPEERTIKQRLIVRQSSLSNAITMLKTDKKALTVEEVFPLAEQLDAFVYGTKAKEELNPMADFADDIPY